MSKKKNTKPTPETAMLADSFQKIIEHAADFVATIAPDGQLLHVNESGRFLLTLLDEDDIPNMNLSDLISEADRPHFIESALPTAIQDGLWQGHMMMRSIDGIEIPIAQRLIAQPNADGQVHLLGVLGRDITDRQWIENSLQESETRFRNSFENTSLGMALVSTEGHLLQVNTAVTEMLGYTQQELMNKDVFELLHPEQISRTGLPIQQLQKGEVNTIKGEAKYLCKNGAVLWGYINATAIQDVQENLSYFILQIQDITEQKQAEISLKERENQLQETLITQERQLEIGHALATAQTEQEVLDILIEKANYYRQAAMSITYWETDTNGEKLDIVKRQSTFDSGIEMLKEGTKTAWNESPLSQQYSPNSLFISNDIADDARIDADIRHSFGSIDIKGFAILPMVASGEWLGNMAVMTKETNFFTEQVVSLYRALAEQGSIALRGAQLFEETQQTLERRSQEVALTIQIAQEIASAPNLTDLYQRIVNQISQQFNYYHVQLLRYDPFLDTVALIYGYGKIGQEMLDLNHSIPLGVGLIGSAAESGQTTYRDNVKDDPDWQANPLLQKTQSEIAVPIKLGGEVLGVLDVQSDRLDAFREDDQLLLEGLCGQIAVAIETTRLREEMDARVHELTTLQRYMSREGWESYRTEKVAVQPGYQFDHQGVAALVDELDLVPTENGEGTGEETAVISRKRETSLTVIGGEVIGKIGIEEDDDNPLSDEDLDFIQSVSVQVAEALEAARLFEQTQDALSEQERLSTQLETVAKVSTAASTVLEVDNLLQAVVDLTKASFGLYHTHIYLMDASGQNLVLRAGADQVGRLMTLEGRRINLYDEAIVARAARSKEGIVENDVRKIVDFLPNPLLPQTRAELAVPLIIGDKAIGVLDLQADQVDFFTEEDINIHRTLASQIAVAVQNASLFAEQVETSEKLREVDRLKSEFLASMSHELRTPLNSIIGFADVLLEGLDGELNERMEEDVRLIRDSGRHLRELIGDILDLSKIESGRMEMRYEEIDMHQMSHDIIANAAPLAEAKNLKLHLKVSDEVDTIEADRTRLRQVLWNIMGNAIKFTEKGSVTLSVDIEGHDMLVGIHDTGIGIDKEQIPIVFEQFRQIDGNLNRSAGGTGLGMPITKKLVELHGGEIWIESTMGQGSTFWVSLPTHQYYRKKKKGTAPLDMG